LSKKILVVDDTTDTRDLLHMYLKTAGYTVFMAADGGEGLYQAKMDEPDLIITDISMPNLDGYDMIRQLRAIERFAAVPIIALTAYGDEQLEKARDAGADHAVSKPMNLEELVELVNSLLALP
jgi:CheY-like chemotaxis protein